MKIIFLDIDGVLNPLATSYESFSEQIRILPKAMENLKHLVDTTDAKIVLSSSWRNQEQGRKDIAKVLNHYGMSFIGSIPDHEGKYTRGDEILSWFEETYIDKEKIKYVILDYLCSLA